MKIKINPDSGINNTEISQIIVDCSHIDPDFENLSLEEFSEIEIDGLGQFVLEETLTLNLNYAFKISGDVFEIVGKLEE